MSVLDRVPFLKKLLDAATTMIIVIILSVLVGLLLAFPVMWLWNFIFVPMNANMAINVFQAWALNILCGILFGPRSSRREVSKK